MQPIIAIENIQKTYKSGFKALNGVSLTIQPGEIFALLGPNGAGKTTLIGTVCGLVRPSGGRITVDGLDIHDNYREVRQRIGLVPQELAVSMFESVWDTVKFSRGLFGCKPNDDYLAELLKNLSLWEKKDTNIMALSGGMKRRVLIAKALAHEPRVLFLDEPTAGVDVELRRDMWSMIRKLREQGVTIILTTHYIEEAEDMADRIGVISKGEIILVEQKHDLMQQLGKKTLTVHLAEPLDKIPELLANYDISISDDSLSLIYQYSTADQQDGVAPLLEKLASLNIGYQDLSTKQSSLEEIFVSLVAEKVEAAQ
ncbi:ABC transporter ATP-binding protein [Gilvimarinus sp. SDUM040013]|uniref:ABC transporter ATP-binding protein n=1 Tax=Gilvimarinus gilvus TaxID=3058038 RepID=A0ABU4RYC1_9GAMM|nr:ABC transporter ATP-binding protein [Gilvimarinus sp. SDUM040013]MDO3385199.1 ABC transporter ATP-binding protein [Gilvimarinus sp. SDUM040013]MDX6849182.1 ABC transporter ATP-binding protein [Gilvimarinus sp. SDUM040013]